MIFSVDVGTLSLEVWGPKCTFVSFSYSGQKDTDLFAVFPVTNVLHLLSNILIPLQRMKLIMLNMFFLPD